MGSGLIGPRPFTTIIAGFLKKEIFASLDFFAAW